ncbi:MAG: hypothetical protein ACE5HQ_03020 [Gemmatimonadota bacterium]
MRRLLRNGLLILVPLATGCATARRGPDPFNSLYITSADLEGVRYKTAFDVLAHHRRLLIQEGEIAFRGGANLDGENKRYSLPLIVVNGDYYLGSPTTVLRLIPTRNIAVIELIYASEVGPRLRRPEASGGVIQVTTKDGHTPAG